MVVQKFPEEWKPSQIRFTNENIISGEIIEGTIIIKDLPCDFHCTKVKEIDEKSVKLYGTLENNVCVLLNLKEDGTGFAEINKKESVLV